MDFAARKCGSQPAYAVLGDLGGRPKVNRSESLELENIGHNIVSHFRATQGNPSDALNRLIVFKGLH